MFVQGRAYPVGRAHMIRSRRHQLRHRGTELLCDDGHPARRRPWIYRTATTRGPEIAIINEAAARKFFPNENPVGRRFGNRPKRSGNIEIVGVLRDVRYNSLREPAPPTLLPSVPSGRPGRISSSPVRTAGDPAAVMAGMREALSDINPEHSDCDDRNADVSDRAAVSPRKRCWRRPTRSSAASPLFVAAIGLFGLMSYNVSRRTREIGIRMAMGAQREEVLRLVVRESMLLVVGRSRDRRRCGPCGGRLCRPSCSGSSRPTRQR